jgi:nucleoid DNA-binding protein
MTYKDLIDRVSKERDITKKDAKEFIECIFDTLSDELADEKGVSIPGLGTFKTKTREERKAYSPHHETYILVPPKCVVDFTPSSTLKDNLKFVETGDE